LCPQWVSASVSAKSERAFAGRPDRLPEALCASPFRPQYCPPGSGPPSGAEPCNPLDGSVPFCNPPHPGGMITKDPETGHFGPSDDGLQIPGPKRQDPHPEQLSARSWNPSVGKCPPDGPRAPDPRQRRYLESLVLDQRWYSRILVLGQCPRSRPMDYTGFWSGSQRLSGGSGEISLFG
jgi:hypothetical protein